MGAAENPLADGSAPPSKADAVLGVADSEDAFADILGTEQDLSSYNAYYTFGDPKFSTFQQDADTGLYQSFALTYDSKQACATIPEKKFQMVFELTCDRSE